MTTASTKEPEKKIDCGRLVDEQDQGIAARYKLNDIFCQAWLSHAITAIVEHKVPDCIEDSAEHFKVIAERTGLHAPSLYRTMRALAANGIFEEHTGGNFAHNDASRLLRSDHPYSWVGMARMWNHPSCLRAWKSFSRVLEDGHSGIEHAFGKPLYAHLADFPEATKAFSDAMVSNSAHVSESLATQFNFKRYETVMDLGGGEGTLLLAILKANPHLRGINFEIPDLEEISLRAIKENDLASRCTFQSGDFLEEIPAGPDLYMIKNSMWNWSDDDCLKIMRNVRIAMSTRRAARFLIVEYVIDERNKPWSTLYDLQILNMPGGRARTVEEYRELLSQAGFALEKVDFVEDETLLLAAPR